MESARTYGDFDPVTPKTPHTPGSGRPLLSAQGTAQLSPYGNWIRGELVTIPRSNADRTFKCFSERSDTRAPENEKEFVLALEKTAKKVADFAQTLNGKEQDLHQRQAQMGEIEAKHTRFAEELTSIRDLLQGDVQTASENYSKIAPLQDHKKQAAACRHLLDIELSLTPLEKIYEELAPLLAAPLHQEALEFYKRRKKECEALALVPTLEERILSLEKIVDEVDKGVRKILPQLEGKYIALKEQTELLCLELVDFTYAATTLIKTTPLPQSGRFQWLWSLVVTPQAVLPESTEEQDGKITLLQTKLQGLIKLILPQRQGEDENEVQELTKLVKFYLAQASKDALEPEDRFRRNPLVSKFVYGQIQEEKNALENIAKALARLAKDIKELRNDIVCGKKIPKEQEEQSAILAGLRVAINNQLIKLRNHTLSNRIHAGWYYVARLLVKAHDVELFLEQLKSLSNRSFTPYAKAIGDLFAYVDPQEEELKNNPDYETSLIATERLFTALDSASKLTRPIKQQRSSEKLRTKLYDTIEQVLSRAGARTLALTHREESLADSIFIHDPLIKFMKHDEPQLGILPEAFINLLIKGFVRALYYSKSQFDPQLDLVLYTLQHTPAYQKAFLRTLEKTKNFKIHLQNYLIKNDMEHYSEELALLTKALYVLKKNPFATGHEKLFRYLEARQHLKELENLPLASQQEQIRRAWVKEASIFLFTESEQLLSPYYSADKLSSHLEKSLFGTNCEDANAYVVETLKQMQFHEIPTDATLLTVLQGWALQALMQKPDEEIPHGGYLLNTLFEGYFRDEGKRAAWRNLHGVGFMERALYRASKRYPQVVKNLRDPIHDDVYESVIPIYDAFSKVLQEIEELPDSQAENLLKQMHSQFNTHLPVEVHPPEADTHIGVARWCVIDATAKYATRLSTRFEELLANQPNESFLEKSKDHVAASSLRDSLRALFSEGMPEIATAAHPDATVNFVRSYRHSIGMTLTLHTTPFHLGSGKPGNDQDQ